MELDGTHTLNAPVEAVWNLLMDPDILAKATPGVKHLEALGEDHYKAASQVKMGPVNGLFDGEMFVLDKLPPNSFTLRMTMKGKIGNVDASGQMALNALGDDQTEVVFSGSAQLSGTIARTGQRVLNGVAKTMTKQFFKSLEKEIKALQADDSSEKGQFFKKWFDK